MADNKVILGSGELYIADYNSTTGIPEDAALEIDTNKIGNISGGAELVCTAEVTNVTDDFNVSVKEFITKETASLKTGVLTYTLDVLNKLILNGEVETGAIGEPDTLYIGGRNKNGIKRYVVRFVHEFETSKKLRVTIVGSPNGEFNFKFDKENPTIIDTTFNAVSHDDDGTLVIVAMDK